MITKILKILPQRRSDAEKYRTANDANNREWKKHTFPTELLVVLEIDSDCLQTRFCAET